MVIFDHHLKIFPKFTQKFITGRNYLFHWAIFKFRFSIKWLKFVRLKNFSFKIFKLRKNLFYFTKFDWLFMKLFHVINKNLKCLFTIRAIEFISNIPHKTFKLIDIFTKSISFAIMFLDVLDNIIVCSNFAERMPLIFLHFLYLKNCIKTYLWIFQFVIYIPECIS